MRNFTLISWTDQSAQSGYASLDTLQNILLVCTCFSSSGIHNHDTLLILQPQVPFGIKYCHQGIWSLCVNKTHHSLTACSESTQNAQNWHCNKCVMKRESKSHTNSLNCFWLSKVVKMKNAQNVFWTKFSPSVFYIDEDRYKYKYIWFVWSFLSWYKMAMSVTSPTVQVIFEMLKKKKKKKKAVWNSQRAWALIWSISEPPSGLGFC